MAEINMLSEYFNITKCEIAMALFMMAYTKNGEPFGI